MTASARESGSDPNTIWTIARVLAWAAEDLGRRGLTDSPRLDAELLLGHVLNADRVKLIVDSQRPLQPDELGRFKQMLLRRRKAEPIAYILGRREFYGLDFTVDPNVLIPRPSTETLVEVALRRSAPRHMFGRLLDVCTGSGCVAICFARERPTWRVVGSDVSEGALAVARRNAQRLGAIWNVSFRHSDLLAAFGSERFELITANPPYIPDAEIATLAPDIQKFEPRGALAGGADGLDLLRRLIDAAPKHLTPGGVLALEIGAGQAPDIERALARAGYIELQRERDYDGIERIVSGRTPPAPDRTPGA
ncbi:MAG: peptide chain release factor N(5)-glutamine methyltransferase [Polyangiaceae bacterium]